VSTLVSAMEKAKGRERIRKYQKAIEKTINDKLKSLGEIKFKERDSEKELNLCKIGVVLDFGDYPVDIEINNKEYGKDSIQYVTYSVDTISKYNEFIDFIKNSNLKMNGNLYEVKTYGDEKFIEIPINKTLENYNTKFLVLSIQKNVRKDNEIKIKYKVGNEIKTDSPQSFFDKVFFNCLENVKFIIEKLKTEFGFILKSNSTIDVWIDDNFKINDKPVRIIYYLKANGSDTLEIKNDKRYLLSGDVGKSLRAPWPDAEIKLSDNLISALKQYFPNVSRDIQKINQDTIQRKTEELSKQQSLKSEKKNAKNVLKDFFTNLENRKLKAKVSSRYERDNQNYDFVISKFNISTDKSDITLIDDKGWNKIFISFNGQKTIWFKMGSTPSRADEVVFDRRSAGILVKLAKVVWNMDLKPYEIPQF